MKITLTDGKAEGFRPEFAVEFWRLGCLHRDAMELRCHDLITAFFLAHRPHSRQGPAEEAKQAFCIRKTNSHGGFIELRQTDPSFQMASTIPVGRPSCIRRSRRARIDSKADEPSSNGPSKSQNFILEASPRGAFSPALRVCKPRCHVKSTRHNCLRLSRKRDGSLRLLAVLDSYLQTLAQGGATMSALAT